MCVAMQHCWYTLGVRSRDGASLSYLGLGREGKVNNTTPGAVDLPSR
jgi:hypothetical protein